MNYLEERFVILFGHFLLDAVNNKYQIQCKIVFHVVGVEVTVVVAVDYITKNCIKFFWDINILHHHRHNYHHHHYHLFILII